MMILNLLLSDLIVSEVGPKMGMSNIFNYAPRSKAHVFVIIYWVCSMTVQLKLQSQGPQSCFPVLGFVVVGIENYSVQQQSHSVASWLQRVPCRRTVFEAACCSKYFI